MSIYTFKKFLKNQIPLNIILQSDLDDAAKEVSEALDEAEDGIVNALDQSDIEKQKAEEAKESSSDQKKSEAKADKSSDDTESSNTADTDDFDDFDDSDDSDSGSGDTESSGSQKDDQQQDDQDDDQDDSANVSNKHTSLKLLSYYLTKQLKFKKFDNNLKFRKFLSQQESSAPNSLKNMIDLNTQFQSIRKDQPLKYYYMPQPFSALSTQKKTKLNNAYIYFFTFKQQGKLIKGHFIECVNTSWNHLININGDLSKLQSTDNRKYISK